MNFSNNIKRAVAAFSLIPLVGCAPAPAPAPTPAPQPAPAPVEQRPAQPPASIPAAVPANWMDVTATPGDWSYRAISGQTQAIFGQPGKALMVMTCNPQRDIVTLFRAGSTRSAVPMRILTETATRTLTGVTTSDANPSIKADIQGSDPLLDAMAFSKGRFAVETAGLQTLYLPAWPEVTRVMEDCR